MRKPFIISILLICAMQTALGQVSPVLPVSGCGSEKTTDIDGGRASSTSGDPCLVLGLPSPQQTTVIIPSPSSPYWHQSKTARDVPGSFGGFMDSFVQSYWRTSRNDESSAKNQALLLTAATSVTIPAKMKASSQESCTDACIRRIVMSEDIYEFRVLIYGNSISAVGLGFNDLCNRSWA